MSFSLNNIGATYQKEMKRIFDDMFHQDVECYVDGLMMKSKEKNQLQDPCLMFERLY